LGPMQKPRQKTIQTPLGRWRKKPGVTKVQEKVGEG